MGAEDLQAHFDADRPKIKDQILEGKYKPQPVRRIEIRHGNRRHQVSGHPNGDRQDDPASDPAGALADVRSRLLRKELWIPHGSQPAPSTGTIACVSE